MPKHTHHISRRGLMMMASAALLSRATAADPADYLGNASRHRPLTASMPPGALGQARLAGRGPVAGYFQPIQITGPGSTQFALSNSGSFADANPTLQAGLLIGAVYRFRITRIPLAEGAELYPTIEAIDRTFPPAGLAWKYPIQIQLDQEDLDAALDGRMVTRVIYLEDPQTATPMLQTPATRRPMEISSFQDPLEVADRMGRPVAIVRIGSVTPPKAPQLMPHFLFGDPQWAPNPLPDPTSKP
ncbi:MAG: hypothetical protein P8L85_01925 [Rubripirellula sp.]|nr:hypothetical protein [Rubripirellula sp.]